MVVASYMQDKNLWPVPEVKKPASFLPDITASDDEDEKPLGVPAPGFVKGHVRNVLTFTNQEPKRTNLPNAIRLHESD